ncbi:hypothetical protein TTRE_0000656301 [Trichuris trichiura]|uniref:Uncharacterized protein n=1 Tax=Trichuris trichiura TaxID=36087 RepID=A0A077ZCV7_TRITR|nr:hypothetical protein TTRE_0000656301 [Trichuris trichiura]
MSSEKGEHLWSSNFPDWLYNRLEELGFDALVYTRYIMSVLKQPMPTKDEQGRRDAMPNSNRSTLFECLMSSDMERESVNVFVDDIIGKHAQWERYVCEKRCLTLPINISLAGNLKEARRFLSYDEAFPPLLQSAGEIQTNVKRSANNGERETNEGFANLGKDASAKDEEEAGCTNRSSGATPSKRPKLLEEASVPNSCAAPLRRTDRCSIASDDDDGELFDEISRVVLAFNNAVPCSTCVFPGLAKTGCCCEVGRLLGIWKGDTGDASSLWNLQQRQFPCAFQNFLFGQQKHWLGADHCSKAKSGDVDSFECLLLNGQSTQGRVADPFVSTWTYPLGPTIPLHKVSKFAFSVKDWVTGKCPMPTYSSNNGVRSAAIGDPLLQKQERYGCYYEKAMQKGKRRQAKVRLDPNEIPITTATHFIPIRSESLEKGYYPFLNSEPTRNDIGRSQQDVDEIQLDGEYFVYHDSPAEEEEETSKEQWPTISKTLKRSLTVKFKRAKMDKFCQTDRLVPEREGAAEIASRSSDQLDGRTKNTSSGKETVDSKGLLKRSTANSGSSSECHPGSRLPEALPRELWQYQDEKDDELLIRYVSNISLIAPLDSLAPSVGGM